jgi:hypothetical protein
MLVAAKSSGLLPSSTRDAVALGRRPSFVAARWRWHWPAGPVAARVEGFAAAARPTETEGHA